MVTAASDLTTPVKRILIDRLERQEALIPDTPENLLEVMGALESYAYTLEAYWINLIYIAEHEFLELLPFFKYMNGDRSWANLLKHWRHDRVNYEFAEYCMKGMFWHGGGGLDAFLDTPEFEQLAGAAIAAKIQSNPMMRGLNQLFPGFIIEQVRQMCYYSALGQFWKIMSPLFFDMARDYHAGKIAKIPDVAIAVKNGLVNAAAVPITYAVEIQGKVYDLLPPSAGLTFLVDTAIPYVEAVFLRSLPFAGTLSYNAQACQIPPDQSRFAYGALYADPLPAGGGGIPPTLLAFDLQRFLPDYLREHYKTFGRGESDLSVKLIASFQKSMFCVTSGAIQGLAPFALDTQDSIERQANRKHLTQWVERLADSRLFQVQG